MRDTNRICIITSDYQDAQACEVMTAIEKEANLCGFQVTTFSMLQRSELFTNDEEFIYQLIDFDSYDGFILNAKSFSGHKGLLRKLEDMLKDTDKPVVSVGESRVGIYATINSQSSDPSFEMICDHLIERHGCEMIYFLGGDKFEVVRHPVNGIRKAMERHDLKFYDEWILYGGFWREGAEKLVKDISYGYVDKPDAVICFDDNIARFLINALYKQGIRVPEEIIVTGRNNYFPEPHLFTIATTESDQSELGYHSFSLLYKEITGKEAPDHRKRKLLFMPGMSCGCNRTRPADIRVQLELDERKSTRHMEYRNSYICEKMYTLRNLEELAYNLLNLSYLVPDKRSMGVYLINETLDAAKCIFLTDELESGKLVDCNPRTLDIPGEQSHITKNMHVYPLIFNKEKLGYMTVGYDDAHYSNDLVEEFANHVSTAIYLLKQKGMDAIPVFEQTEEPVSAVTLNTQPVAIGNEPAKKELLKAKNDMNYILGMDENQTTIRIGMESIYYFEGIGSEVFAVTMDGRYKINLRLYECEEMENQRFMRVSKSIVVNLDKVISFKQNGDHTCNAMLRNKSEIRVSRKYYDAFREMIVE